MEDLREEISAIEAEINAMKSLLANSDYEIIKLAESLADCNSSTEIVKAIKAFWGDYQAIVEKRRSWRERIRELQAEADEKAEALSALEQEEIVRLAAEKEAERLRQEELAAEEQSEPEHESQAENDSEPEKDKVESTETDNEATISDNNNTAKDGVLDIEGDEEFADVDDVLSDMFAGDDN